MWWSKKKATRGGNRRRDDLRGQWIQVNARAGEMRREQAHKVGAVIVLAVAAAGTLWATVSGASILGERLFSQNERFVIKRLDLASTGRLEAKHLREFGHLAEGQNLFAVDIEQVRTTLESVPLIRSAEVRRKLPDTLVVRVTERSAIARLAGGAQGHAVTLDVDGYILGLARTPALPLITGAREQGLGPGSVVREKNVLDALKLVELIDQAGVNAGIELATVDVRNDERLELTLADGAKVPFGRDQLAFRIERLAEILRNAKELGQQLTWADLTVDRNIPVRYR